MADYTELCERLKKEQARLNSELERMGSGALLDDERRSGGSFGKREEEANEAVEFEKRLMLEKRLTEALVEINRAIEKCEAGSYGICDHCGKPIELARLEALPQASLCLDCKSHQAKDARSKSAR